MLFQMFFRFLVAFLHSGFFFFLEGVCYKIHRFPLHNHSSQLQFSFRYLTLDKLQLAGLCENEGVATIKKKFDRH